MGVVEPQISQTAGGLTTVVDTIAAPKTAFQRIREQPTWGWAFLIALIMVVIGSIITAPAQQHAQIASMQRYFSKPAAASISDAKKQQMIDNLKNPNPVGRIFGYVAVGIVLLLIVLLNTVVVLIANALGGGDGNFKRYWAGSMNIAVPTFALGTIVVGIIAMIRGADSFSSSIELQAAAPSLGTFIHPSPALTVFFSSISIFSLWGLYLNATQMKTNKVNTTVAWVFAALILLGGASIFAGFTQLLAGFGLA